MTLSTDGSSMPRVRIVSGVGGAGSAARRRAAAGGLIFIAALAVFVFQEVTGILCRFEGMRMLLQRVPLTGWTRILAQSVVP